MLKNVEKMEKNRVKLEIEVAASDVDTALAKAYRQVVKKVSLPGFRKGKVPRRILELRFGPEILHEEALELLVPSAFETALEEADLDPINRPEFEMLQLEESKPLIFTAIIEVLPPVELGEYRGLEVEQEEVVVDDFQIDHHFYMLREQNARLVPREEGLVQGGDLVQIDFIGYIDGELFEGGEAEDYSLEIGSHSFIPGFEDQLIGAAQDEEREIKVTFPPNYRKEDIAGKEATFQVRIKQVKEKQLPELDDEFVKEVSEFESLEEMRTDLQEKLLKNAEEQSKAKLEEKLIEKVTEAAGVEPPETLVERQIDRMIGDLENYLIYQGMRLDQFLEFSGKGKDEIREERREKAKNRTKANLVLDAIAKKEGIAVDDSELEVKIEELATAFNGDPDRFREMMEQRGRIQVLQEEIRIRKVIDLIVSEARIKVVKAKKENGKDPESKENKAVQNEKPAAELEKNSMVPDALPAGEGKE